MISEIRSAIINVAVSFVPFNPLETLNALYIKIIIHTVMGIIKKLTITKDRF